MSKKSANGNAIPYKNNPVSVRAVPYVVKGCLLFCLNTESYYDIACGSNGKFERSEIKVLNRSALGVSSQNSFPSNLDDVRIPLIMLSLSGMMGDLGRSNGNE